MSDSAALRKVLLHRRDLLTEDERARKSDAICKRLVEVPAFQQAEQALFYVSHASEVDTAMMRRIARTLGLDVAVPRSLPGNRGMQFHLLPEDEPFESGPYGILQPLADSPLADLKRNSVVIVPGVGFDRQGHRIGFGSGYYDRWLAGDGKGLPTVGLGFEEQVVDVIVPADHDQPVQCLVTDKETYFF
jgi:5-formyltetrahydrofolate cyclo-ligase